jgi:hypothetical protein
MDINKLLQFDYIKSTEIIADFQNLPILLVDDTIIHPILKTYIPEKNIQNIQNTSICGYEDKNYLLHEKFGYDGMDIVKKCCNLNLNTQKDTAPKEIDTEINDVKMWEILYNYDYNTSKSVLSTKDRLILNIVSLKKKTIFYDDYLYRMVWIMESTNNQYPYMNSLKEQKLLDNKRICLILLKSIEFYLIHEKKVRYDEKKIHDTIRSIRKDIFGTSNITYDAILIHDDQKEYLINKYLFEKDVKTIDGCENNKINIYNDSYIDLDYMPDGDKLQIDTRATFPLLNISNHTNLDDTINSVLELTSDDKDRMVPYYKQQFLNITAENTDIDIDMNIKDILNITDTTCFWQLEKPDTEKELINKLKIIYDFYYKEYIKLSRKVRNYLVVMTNDDDLKKLYTFTGLKKEVDYFCDSVLDQNDNMVKLKDILSHINTID